MINDNKIQSLNAIIMHEKKERLKRNEQEFTEEI